MRAGLLVVVAVAVACGPYGDAGPIVLPRRRTAVFSDWQILAPRGIGGSPTPQVVLSTTGWLGHVTVEWRTRRAAFTVTTAARVIDWPGSLPPLRPGDWCTVRARAEGKERAESAFVRCVGSLAPPVPRPFDGGHAWRLRQGLHPVPEFPGSDRMPRAGE